MEDKKERIVSECVTPLQVGSIRKVILKKNGSKEERYFKILEQLS
jgi:hypothetical protein